jgi:hypothetical protein
VDVVADDKPVTVVGLSFVAGVNTLLEVVLGDLDLLRGQLVVVIGIEVEVGNDVTKISHDFLACLGARRVRRAHVGRVLADDIADSHLVLDHLVVNLFPGDCTEVLVGPCVRGDLVTVVVHLLDNTCPVLVNGTLSNVVTSDEESGMSSSCLELAHNAFGVDVWTIVVRDSNGPWVVADVDTKTTVRDASKLGSVVVAGACSSRSLVGVCRTINKLLIVQEIEYSYHTQGQS